MAGAARPRLSRGIMGRLRLASQGLVGPGLGTVPDAVRWMTAMQAQDLQAALWAVGQRVPGSGIEDVRSALDRAEIVRSWPMRGTLHLLAPEDLRWMLALTSGRMIRGMAGRHRELGITSGDVQAARGAALRLVSGGGAATREELFQAFQAAGQPTAGQRGIHLLSMLCQRGWLVQGPLRGRQQLVVAFGEWIPESRELDREEGIAELLLRYLRSHGPATERDFAWWSGIPLTEVRTALAGVRHELVGLEFEGTGYWLSPATAALLDHGVPGARSVLALPGFDEFLLGYTDRSLVLPARHADKIVPGGNGMFRKTIVAGGEVVGTWAGPGTGRGADVVPEPFDGVNGLRPAAQKSFGLQAAKYRRFLGSGKP
ncbi:winged helix DNA-binding domain-containing protein [Arthrobacter sp. PAMC25564]|uniref:winged helix DNA-binding domain-containing protein n=1 Tax=Arthrobacter sp. PAMC25564 TaxID=2565366 RepID=UPI0010A28D6E|nr:winged helix DNA-binding domain-containing protein [Arthrobacter sp. PAMC25564]QCB96680.1 winged helix DNA-binding domain-containing protein [Arthrobacter sp. PAMC25564]